MRLHLIQTTCLGLLLATAGTVTAQVPPAATPQGAITAREFRPVDGTLNTLTNMAGFPDSPDRVAYPSSFEWPAGEAGAPPPGDTGANNYGVQIIGYFYPPANGQYTFAIASDDQGRLFLSTDANPANKQLIAQENSWNGVRAFDNPIDETTGLPVDRRREVADATTGRMNNVSVPITLTANTPYYIEALMAEGSGGDSLAVTYTTDGSFPLDGAEPIPGSQLRSFDRADGPLATTTVPQSQSVAAGESVTFTLGLPTGTPPYSYEWMRDGAVITDVDTGLPIGGTSYTIDRVETSDSGAKFSVRITNPDGSITTPEATLTVTSDTTAPTMAKVTSSDSFNQVVITYSEPMADTAADPANYTISNGVTVSAARFQEFDITDPALPTNKVVVVLTTSTQPQNTQLTLTVNATNVEDLYGNALSPNTATFRTFEFRSGVVLYKRWNTIAQLSTLTNDPIAMENPTVVETRTVLETGGDFAENFTAQMKGYFMPATTGDYVFYGASDDNMLMFLSTDEDPANQKLILADIGWQNNREWTGIGSATTTGNGTDVAYEYRRGQVNPEDPFGPWTGPFENRSDQFITSDRYLTELSANPVWPNVDGSGNAVIHLEAGERYYFEVFHQEGTGGDRAQVTFKLAGETDPANGSASRITGNLIGAVVDVSSFPPTISQAPTGVNIFNKGDSFSYSVTAENPSSGELTYQWKLNKKAIPGATSATLNVTNADVDDVGDYSVEVRNANGVTSTHLQDNQARAIMRGAFVIEAEDFNHGGGQTVAAASTMPLGTNYYTGLDGLPGIDFLLSNQSTTDPAANGNAYRNGWVSNSVNIPFPTAPNALGNVDVTGNNADVNRGDFSLTNNFKIGWGTAGEWFQYTRDIPPGQYNAVVGVSRDGSTTNGLSFALDIVTAGANTETATVTPVGTVTSSFTGGWSSNDLLPLRAVGTTDGTLATYNLGPASTLRLTIVTGDPDLDYILLYPAGSGGGGDEPTISVDRTGGQIVITFEGTLYGSDTVDGTYAPVTGVTGNTYTVPTTGTMRFFQAVEQP